MTNEVMEQKKKVSRADFDMRVESEYCWLVRWEYMKKAEAWAKAVQVISAEYVAD